MPKKPVKQVLAQQPSQVAVVWTLHADPLPYRYHPKNFPCTHSRGFKDKEACVKEAFRCGFGAVLVDGVLRRR